MAECKAGIRLVAEQARAGIGVAVWGDIKRGNSEQQRGGACVGK